MGYPMTWKRLINRNGLADGDYTLAPQRHAAGVPANFTEATTTTVTETMLARAPALAERVRQYERAMKMLAGDLRRLERDATDEDGICGHIASRTGTHPEIVAAVLKEFISW